MNRLLAGDQVTSKSLNGIWTVVEDNYDGSCVISDSEGNTYTIHTAHLEKVNNS